MKSKKYNGGGHVVTRWNKCPRHQCLVQVPAPLSVQLPAVVHSARQQVKAQVWIPVTHVGVPDGLHPVLAVAEFGESTVFVSLSQILCLSSNTGSKDIKSGAFSVCV